MADISDNECQALAVSRQLYSSSRLERRGRRQQQPQHQRLQNHNPQHEIHSSQLQASTFAFATMSRGFVGGPRQLEFKVFNDFFHAAACPQQQPYLRRMPVKRIQTAAVVFMSSTSSASTTSTTSADGPHGGQRNLSRRSFVQFTAAATTAVVAATSSILAPAPTSAAARPESVNRPDLLPDTFSSVIDLQNFLATGDERRLRERLTDLETRTSYKIRVLTQRYPVTPGLAVKDYWGVDAKTVVLVADYFAGGGSLLHFTVGDDVATILPPRFWSVLTSRFGNRFYVSQNGEDAAILAAVDAIRTCLLAKGCNVPPQDARLILQK